MPTLEEVLQKREELVQIGLKSSSGMMNYTECIFYLGLIHETYRLDFKELEDRHCEHMRTEFEYPGDEMMIEEMHGLWNQGHWGMDQDCFMRLSHLREDKSDDEKRLIEKIIRTYAELKSIVNMFTEQKKRYDPDKKIKYSAIIIKRYLEAMNKELPRLIWGLGAFAGIDVNFVDEYIFGTKRK